MPHNTKTLILITQVSGLLLFGIALERGLAAFEHWIPREIYFEPSFTLAMFSMDPFLLLAALVVLSPALQIFLPGRAGDTNAIDWKNADSIGGLRWLAFCVVVSLCWSHAGYPFNYFFGIN